MNSIDKIFKNKLEHYNADVPGNSWENIAARLPENKKKNYYGLAVTSLVTIILISFGGYFLFNSNTEIKTLDPASNTPTRKSINSPMAGLNNILPSTVLVQNDIHRSAITVKQQTSQLLQAEKQKYSKIRHTDIAALTQPVLDNSSIVNKTYNESTENIESNIVIAKRDKLDIPLLKHELNDQKLKFFRALRFEIPSAKDAPAKACPFVTNYKDKSLDIYYSSDFIARKLTSDNELYNGYLNMRNQTEKSIYSFSAGVRFGYNLSYRWNLHTGLNYSQINEKFEYIDPESNQTRIITIKDYVYLNGKIVDSIITEEEVIIPGTTKLKVYNKFKTIDIPVIARYTLLANNKISLSATTGIFINLALNERGMILDKDATTPIAITSQNKTDNAYFKSQLGLSLYGGLNLAYHLTSNIDLLFEPNVKIQTENMTTEHYPLKQRYNTYGIATGLRYKF